MGKKISFPIAITVIIILVVILVGGILVFQYRFPETGLIIFFPKLGITFSGDCNELMRQINNLVEKANYCDEDSDCVISTETTKFCGCYSLINKNANLSKIKEGNEKYERINCPVLICGECMIPPEQEDIKCKNNKCVDSRFEKKLTILVDGEPKDASGLGITIPIDKNEALLVAKQFCNKELQEIFPEGIYGIVEKVGDEWRIQITVVNCICYTTVQIDNGETECFVSLPMELE